MFKLFLLCALAVVVLADKHVPIVSQEMTVDPDGHFHWSYESGDGSKAVQDGELKAVDKDSTAEVMRGRYSYFGDDGQKYTVAYTADEFGFHPEGAHLPVAPPVPAPILRALAWIASHPSKED